RAPSSRSPTCSAPRTIASRAASGSSRARTSSAGRTSGSPTTTSWSADRTSWAARIAADGRVCSAFRREAVGYVLMARLPRVILVRRPLRAPVTLRGRRCSDGKALRFWYRAEAGEPPGAGSSSQLEQEGDLVAQLHAGEPPITQPALGYPGYMLFSAPGKWKVS